MLSAYEVYCIDFNISELSESLKLIEKVFFLHRPLDYSVIELLDGDHLLAHVLLFLIRNLDAIPKHHFLALEKVQLTASSPLLL